MLLCVMSILEGSNINKNSINFGPIKYKHLEL
jgi:hypothetical protein